MSLGQLEGQQKFHVFVCYVPFLLPILDLCWYLSGFSGGFFSDSNGGFWPEGPKLLFSSCACMPALMCTQNQGDRDFMTRALLQHKGWQALDYASKELKVSVTQTIRHSNRFSRILKSAVGTIIADPGKCFQELTSENLLISLRDRPYLWFFL